MKSYVDEKWVDIKGYDGSYKVSDHGRIKSLDREYVNKRGQNRKIKGRILKNSVDTHGYMRVTLSDNERVQKSYKVHILVANAFVEGKSVERVNASFIDGDKLNASADNLIWASESTTSSKGAKISGRCRTKEEFILNGGVLGYE